MRVREIDDRWRRKERRRGDKKKRGVWERDNSEREHKN
jgi:hypothetical protein